MDGSAHKIAAKNIITEKELSECDREKLHLLGHIQGDSGHTIFVTYPEGRVIASDQNIGAVPFVHRQDTKESHEASSEDEPKDSIASIPNEACHELMGSLLKSWIPPSLNQEIVDAVEDMIKAKSQRTFHFSSYKEEAFAVSLSSSEKDFSVICIEIEFTTSEADDSFYNTLVSLGQIMEFYADEKIVRSACDTVFNLLGEYDRGMVYQFNDDLSGEVVHEIKKDSVTTSYLGMRFPASDIPLPARQLYIKNGLRYIENVDADDLPIISENDRKIDLSNCRMRAVAKPHLIYLRNMGVICSLSIAIVVENELWGLLAFHGYTKPFKPSLHQRIACETINSMVSVKVETLTKKSQSNRIITLSEMLMKWDPNFDVAFNLSALGSDLLPVLDADILVARVMEAGKEEPEVVKIGDEDLVPGQAFWDSFTKRPSREIYSVNTREAITGLGLTLTDCPASGVAFFQDGLIQVMLGRGLRSKDVIWAGNPDEPKLRIGGILNPRNSFDEFMEKARKESRAWSSSDIHVLSSLMDRVTEHSHNHHHALLKSGIEEANVKYFNAISRSQENCEFFAQMSHELRTPFHGVMGCLNILYDSMPEMSEEDVEDMIDTALSSGNQMINLLNDILSLSKNKFTQGLANDKTRYPMLAEESIRGMKALAMSKSIAFNRTLLPEDNNAIVITDRKKVVQIFSNIVSNAIKFSDGGTIDVRFDLVESLKESFNLWATAATGYAGTVFTLDENEIFDSIESVKSRVMRLPENKERKWLVFSVTDSGCGIKANELAEMLKPYTQSSRGSNRVFQGTGIGLFICVSLTYQLGGFLACSSTPGVGTIFHVAIPVTVVEGDAVDDSDFLGTLSELCPSDGSIPMTGPIVICDDNLVNVKILKRALEIDLKHTGLEQIEVITATGGGEVVALYKKRRPSLLFIDYHMPDFSGDRAILEIRRYEDDEGLTPSYIIIYTADLTDEATQTLQECGTNEIVSKPPPKGYITSLIQRLEVEGPTKTSVE